MNSNDISLAITILVFFILMMFANVFIVGKKNIQKNWNVYKCNPIILAFSGEFLNGKLGQSVNPKILPAAGTGDNYNDFTSAQRSQFASASVTKCVEAVGVGAMEEVQGPMNSLLDVFIQIGKSIGSAFMFALSFFNSIKQFMVGMVDNIFKIITSSYLGMMMYQQKTQSILQRYVITMQVMLDTLNTGTHAIGKIYNNWPVNKMFKNVSTLDELPVASFNNEAWGFNTQRADVAACFYENNLIKLKNNIVKRMVDVKLGDILNDGSRIIGTMQLLNDSKSSLYLIKNTSDNMDIYVTESHLIKHNNKYIKVKDYPDKLKTNIIPTHLVCFITDTHIIKLGEHTFSDWEEISL